MSIAHTALAITILLTSLTAQRVLAIRSGDRDADRLGVVLSAIGDVNADGVTDLAAVAAETQGYFCREVEAARGSNPSLAEYAEARSSRALTFSESMRRLLSHPGT
jgi:hypothetical protein